MPDPVDTWSKLKVHKTEGAVEKYSKKLMLCTSYQQPWKTPVKGVFL